MARINLLPWRDELRKQRQRDFVVAAATAAAVGFVIVVAVHVHIAGLIDHQNTRNAYLEREIREVEAKIREIDELEKKKEQLIARMKIIEQLQGNRSEVVHIFDEIVRAVPDGLHLLTLKQQQGVITLSGRAQSNARVSALMRNLDASSWFRDPVLDVIQVNQKEADRTRTFTLRVKQVTPQDEAPR